MMLQQQQWKVTNAPSCFFFSVPDKKYKFPNGCAMVGEAIKDIEHLLVSYHFFFFWSFPGLIGGSIYVCGCNLK